MADIIDKIADAFDTDDEKADNSCIGTGRQAKKTRTDAPQQLADKFSQYDANTPPPPDIVSFTLDVTDADTSKDWYLNDYSVPVYDWTSYVYIVTLGTDTRRSTYGHYTPRLLTLVERYVLSYIYQHAVVKHENVVKVNQQYLSDNLNMSRGQINNIIRVLTDAKLIIKLPTQNGTRGINCTVANIKITSNDDTDLSKRIDRFNENFNDENTFNDTDLSKRIDTDLSKRIDSTNTTNTDIVCADAHRAPTESADNKQSEDASTPQPKAKRQRKQPERKLYGEFNNIPFADDEYAKAREQYGEPYLSDKINDMSAYYANNPKKPHNNGLALLRTWTRKDKEYAAARQQTQQKPEPTASSDLSDVNEI